MFAEVVVNRPTHRRPPPGTGPIRDSTSRVLSYTYRLPEHLRDQIAIGHLVRVPLGPGSAQGVVIDLTDRPREDLPTGTAIREVTELLDPLPVVTSAQIELAHWVALILIAPKTMQIINGCIVL